MTKKIIQFKPKDNAEDVKLVLLLIYQGHNTIHNFIEEGDMCFMVADVDPGVEEDLVKFGFKTMDMPNTK